MAGTPLSESSGMRSGARNRTCVDGDARSGTVGVAKHSAAEFCNVPPFCNKESKERNYNEVSSLEGFALGHSPQWPERSRRNPLSQLRRAVLWAGISAGFQGTMNRPVSDNAFSVWNTRTY